MIKHLEQIKIRLSAGGVLLVAIILVAIIGAIDYFSGYEISFSIFYIIPIAFTAWSGQKKSAVFICILSTISWLIFDITSGHFYTHFLIPFWNAFVRLAFFTIIARLLLELKDRLHKEEQLARTDGLTGLLNARTFRLILKNSLELARRNNQPTVIAYIDLDNFKAINDSQGHATGDEVLKTVATTIAKSIRETDRAGRMGGDEFAILLPYTYREGADIVITKMQRNLENAMKQKNWPISFSIGVAIINDTFLNYESVIKMADDLMYRIKKSGMNRVLIEEY